MCNQSHAFVQFCQFTGRSFSEISVDLGQRCCVLFRLIRVLNEIHGCHTTVGIQLGTVERDGHENRQEEQDPNQNLLGVGLHAFVGLFKVSRQVILLQFVTSFGLVHVAF
ncbi:MAG: hypothetical protein CMM07_20620 [Rhodopirellula sp.]|nr:hypothetical protein [Rhodopirellula sp.]